MSSYTEYLCEITGKTFNQKSHIDKHLKSTIFKQECKIKELELEKLSKEELKREYKTSKIVKIIKNLSCVKKEEIEISNSENELDTDEMPDVNQSYSNKDTLRDMVHSIHNFLRNKGAGYGMGALKLFNLFYGLKKIEDNEHFDKTDLPNCCKFSEIKKEFISNNQIGLHNLLCTVLPALYQEKKIKDLLFTPIPETIRANTIKILIEMIEKLVTIEESNFQLTGKIYEYFIGRDATAISELGAYFTDRYITNYIYEKLLKPTLDDNGNVRTFIDMFGGSGGFTLGYMNYLNDNCKPNWKDNLNKVYHYDMNLDVVKYAKLEYYCLTGEFPDNNIGTRNSFQDEFLENSENKKYHYICTNPPYGGDKIEKTEQVEIMQMIKKEIEQYFKEKYKIKNMKQVSKLKLTSIEKNKIKQFTEVVKKLTEIDEQFRCQTVMLSNSSNRFQQYAKDNKMDGSKCKDKEAVSFLMMMNMLEKGGTAVGVLKEGIFFDSKYGHIREHLIENFNVTKVVSIDASQFENTTTKTSIIMFSNTGKTEQIEFYDFLIDKEKKTTVEEKEDGIYEMKTFKDRIVNVYDKHISSATYNQLVENEYTLNYKKYNKIVLVPNDGYEMVRLGDICEINFGKRITKSNDGVLKDSEIKFPVYGGGDITFYTSKKNRNKHTLIVSRFAVSKKCVRLIEEDFYLNDGALSLISTINQEYLNYILLNYQDIIYSITTGSIQKGLDIELFKDLQLPIPKTEQKMKYWVDKINKPYNRLIECKEKLKSLEKKVQTDIQKMLDNNETEDVVLDNLCELKASLGGTNLTQYYVDKSDNGFITGKNLNGNNNMNYINKDGFEICKKFSVKEGDILIQEVYNENSNCMLVPKEWNNYIFKGSFRLNNFKISNNFLFHYINSHRFKDTALKLTTGSVFKHLSISILKSFKITIPIDRKLLDSLNPLFKEIDSLNEEIPKQEQLYNQYIEELRKNAIKDTSNKQINEDPIINSDGTKDDFPLNNIKKNNIKKNNIKKNMNSNII